MKAKGLLKQYVLKFHNGIFSLTLNSQLIFIDKPIFHQLFNLQKFYNFIKDNKIDKATLEPSIF
ncbi:hypothetical protein DV092_15880 [Clostridium botulinum]|nr:hypothetical protein [Clostridium botulinum]